MGYDGDFFIPDTTYDECFCTTDFSTMDIHGFTKERIYKSAHTIS